MDSRGSDGNDASSHFGTGTENGNWTPWIHGIRFSYTEGQLCNREWRRDRSARKNGNWFGDDCQDADRNDGQRERNRTKG